MPPVEVPTPWERIVQLTQENTLDSLGQLGRNSAQMQVYQSNLAQVRREYASVQEYCKARFLDYETYPNADGLLEARRPASAQGRIVSWRLNDYPYNFEAGIQHYVLWSETELREDEIQAVIKRELPNHETAVFVNPPVLQSVAAVWHCHVIARLPPQT